MPTGYTAGVADGEITDFRTFALMCARQFGATIMQRDDPMSEPPKLREVSEYALRSVRESEEAFLRWNAMTIEEAAIEQQRERAELEARYEEIRKDNAIKRARYEAMLTKVMQWEPPTPEHEKMKQFMISQLEESVSFDCNDSYYLTLPPLMTPRAWLEDKQRRAAATVARDAQMLKEERQRVIDSNSWITALYESLEQLPAEVR